MPDLRFAIAFGRAVGQPSPVAAPGGRVGRIGFAFTVANTGGEPVESLALRVQISIRAHLRRYSAPEAVALAGVFGHPSTWERSLGPIAWCEVSAQVDAFTAAGSGWAEADLEPGSAAANYCAAVTAGDIPLLFLFRGRTVYWEQGARRVAPVPWDREAAFRLPVAALRAGCSDPVLAAQAPGGHVAAAAILPTARMGGPDHGAHGL